MYLLYGASFCFKPHVVIIFFFKRWEDRLSMKDKGWQLCPFVWRKTEIGLRCIQLPDITKLNLLSTSTFLCLCQPKANLSYMEGPSTWQPSLLV